MVFAEDGSTTCTTKECPAFPQSCHVEAITYDGDGCCKICSEPEKLGNH